MTSDRIENKQEFLGEPASEAPAVESFLDGANATKFWPEQIATNEVFIEQINARKELRERLGDVVSQFPRPDISLEAAISKEQLAEEQVEKLYSSLSDLLESDQNYERLALYLPFEFLPNTTWEPKSKKLVEAKERFSMAYLKAFKGLLLMHDVRTNFVDGDVLEADQKNDNHPRVVKAAHLLPKLVEKGLVTIKDIETLTKETDDELLKSSIAEALMVINDNGKSEEKEEERMSVELTFQEIKALLEKEFSAIDSQKFGNITEKRKKWLKERQKQETVERLGKNLSLQINEVDGAEFLLPEATVSSQQVLIEGIRNAVESAAASNLKKAQELYGQHKEVLLKLWSQNKNTEALSKTFQRFYKLGIVDGGQLEALNIPAVNLEGPFSVNLENMKEEVVQIQEIIRGVEANPELSKLIYPVVLVFGSRLKGYGSKDADIDLGVFVRPKVSVDQEGNLQDLLKVFNTGTGLTEFWLEEKNGKLVVDNTEKPGTMAAKNYWTHILFGSAWEGSPEMIKKIQQELLTDYLYETDEKIEGENARMIYLGEMERDALQYRLMHKGYEKFFPPYGGIHTAHADSIDGESMFYDSGYRQLATKIFINQVFLPKLPVIKK